MRNVKVENDALKTAVAQLQEARAQGNAASAGAAETNIVASTNEIATDKEKEGRTRLRAANRVLVGVGAVIILGFLVYGRPWDDELDVVRHAAGIGVPLAVLLFAFLGLLQRGQGGLLAYVRGKDERLSTSLTQVGLWTMALATAFLYFVSLDALSGENEHSLSKTLGETWTDFPEEYLLLLGGPFAAAVIARFAVGTNVEEGRLQKIETNQTKLRDVVTGDDGRGSLVDAQFLLFNLVALIYFAAALVEAETKLPVIPPVLVGLTSVAALGYTASKAAEVNQPVIRSVTRYLKNALGGIRAGDRVEVRGSNFVPPGTEPEEFLGRLIVRFGTIDVLPELELDEQDRLRTANDTSIVAGVPETLAAGPVDVSVITAAGAQTHSRQITIVPDKAVISGLEPVFASPGEPLTIRGHFFRSPRAAAGESAIVLFDDLVVQASETADEDLKVTVPTSLSGESVDLKVIAAGGVDPSDQIKLRLKSPGD